MTLLERIYRFNKSVKPKMQDESRKFAEKEIEIIKLQAQVLVSFSGMIQFRLPLDVHSRLLRIQVSICS